MSNSFSVQLTGDNAFYNHPNYTTNEEALLKKSEAPVPCYEWNSESKYRRIAKTIISIIIFPIGIYQLIHVFVAKNFLPALNKPTTYTDDLRSKINIINNEGWVYKRISIQMDSCKIDAMIVGKKNKDSPCSFDSKKWVLSSLGNKGSYEYEVQQDRYKKILADLNANGIVFNYPGVGSSEGVPNRETLSKAYRAVLSLLEDDINGIGAEEIIGYGYSLGGGIQGDALKTHQLKLNKKYTFIKDRTFSNLAKEAALLKNSKLAGITTKVLGWNISSVGSSKNLQAPEIILQSADVEAPHILENRERIKDDKIIFKKSSLANKLMKEPVSNKIFYGIPGDHNTLFDSSFLIDKIKELLEKQAI